MEVWSGSESESDPEDFVARFRMAVEAVDAMEREEKAMKKSGEPPKKNGKKKLDGPNPNPSPTGSSDPAKQDELETCEVKGEMDNSHTPVNNDSGIDLSLSPTPQTDAPPQSTCQKKMEQLVRAYGNLPPNASLVQVLSWESEAEN